jgi:hypothetical protein
VNEVPGLDQTFDSAGYSSIPPRRVELHRWPLLDGVPFQRVKVLAGDCIFVPGSFIHAVHSTLGEAEQTGTAKAETGNSTANANMTPHQTVQKDRNEELVVQVTTLFAGPQMPTAMQLVFMQERNSGNPDRNEPTKMLGSGAQMPVQESAQVQLGPSYEQLRPYHRPPCDAPDPPVSRERRSNIDRSTIPKTTLREASIAWRFDGSVSSPITMGFGSPSNVLERLHKIMQQRVQQQLDKQQEEEEEEKESRTQQNEKQIARSEVGMTREEWEILVLSVDIAGDKQGVLQVCPRDDPSYTYFKAEEEIERHVHDALVLLYGNTVPYNMQSNNIATEQHINRKGGAYEAERGIGNDIHPGSTQRGTAQQSLRHQRRQRWQQICDGNTLDELCTIPGLCARLHATAAKEAAQLFDLMLASRGDIEGGIEGGIEGRTSAARQNNEETGKVEKDLLQLEDLERISRSDMQNGLRSLFVVDQIASVFEDGGGNMPGSAGFLDGDTYTGTGPPSRGRAHIGL